MRRETSLRESVYATVTKVLSLQTSHSHRIRKLGDVPDRSTCEEKTSEYVVIGGMGNLNFDPSGEIIFRSIS